jgi:hypothetical protein
MAERYNRLSSWRQVIEEVSESPEYQENAWENETFVRARQRRISAMCRNHVIDHAAFYRELQAIARQEWHDPQLQSRVADMCTYVLNLYEQSSAVLLRMGIEQEIKNYPREVVKIVYRDPPLPQSWRERLFGS